MKQDVVSLVKHGVKGVVNSVRVLDYGAGIEFFRDEEMLASSSCVITMMKS